MEASPVDLQKSWMLYIDGSSNKQGTRVKKVLNSPEGLVKEQTVKFGFSTSNNEESRSFSNF